MPEINVNISKEVFLDVYKPLIGSTNDIEFLYGSRDSGKSVFIAQNLVIKCLTDKYFVCPLIRKVFNTIKDSQWQLIKNVVEDWGLDDFFDFTTHPLEIKCKNGNKFLARGLDDPKKIKSLTNPSCAWIEEGSDLETEDWVLILTSLRSNKNRVQVWCSFNPDMPEDYETTYLYSTFFAHKKDLSFSDTLEVELDKGRTSINYRVTHSTYLDNKYCPPERAFHYENLKNISEYEYLVYAKGLWGKRRTGQEFYKAFNLDKHLKTIEVNPNELLHVSIDSNVFPYIAISIFQVEKINEKYIIKLVHEIPASDPNNTSKRAAELLVKWIYSIKYQNTKIYLYGDRSTKNRNNIDDDKRSFAQIFIETLIKNNIGVVDKFASLAPSVASLGDFVNSIFDGSLSWGEIQISRLCKKAYNDYLETKADIDGSILKKRIKDPKTEISYEPNGHFCDNLKDFIYQAFTDKYKLFQNRFNLTPGGVMQIKRTDKYTF